MVAYQAESDLLALLGPHYARVERGGSDLVARTLPRLRRLARHTHTEIQVTLCPLSSPHRTLAIEAICAALNESATQFPGSRVTMRFAVHPPPQIGLAFPGPRPVQPLCRGASTGHFGRGIGQEVWNPLQASGPEL